MGNCANHKLLTISGRWLREHTGAVAMEFALVLPIMVALLFGVYDIGTAIVINQKAITASQIMADLVTRSLSVTEEDLEDIAQAGIEAMRPYLIEDFSYNIVSIRFTDDDDDGEAEPEICWEAGSFAATDAILESTEPLAITGQGVVVVTVEYDYEPAFATHLMDNLHMSEAAFSRGRRSPVVSFQEELVVGCAEDLDA